MLFRILICLPLLFSSVCVKAQLYQSAFHVGWNTLKPLSDKDYTSRTSSSGVRIGYTKFVSDKFGFGVEGGFNTLRDYVPRQTYEYPGGSLTTDFYNYLYYFTIMGNAQYYFMQGNKFIPYASLGMGVTFSEYRVFYNVFEDTDSKQGFVVRPEVGALFRVKEYSNWGLKASISYDYASNKSDHFATDSFSGLNLLFGVVFFAD